MELQDRDLQESGRQESEQQESEQQESEQQESGQQESGQQESEQQESEQQEWVVSWCRETWFGKRSEALLKKRRSQVGGCLGFQPQFCSSESSMRCISVMDSSSVAV